MLPSKPLRAFTALAALVLILLALPAGASADSIGQVRADADWILSAQLPDGAIANYVDRVAIWPYLSNFAAVGLARASAVTGESRYATAAWRWLRWYQTHQTARGFVTDYRIVDGTERSSGDMDSTDAYAGTFLFAARAAWTVTRDRSQLRRLRGGITMALRAIEATQDRDGLTWAKPSWHVKYLMDQSETYAGLRSAASLAHTLGERRLGARAARDAARLRAGVQRLWNRRLGAYDWALHGDGVHHHTNWAVLYPDALEQVWPVAFGLVTGQRARRLMLHFGAAQPKWDHPASVAQFDSGHSRVGYWAVAAWAFTRVGAPARAATALRRIRNYSLALGRSWPFTPADAGQLLAVTAAGTGAVWAFDPSPGP